MILAGIATYFNSRASVARQSPEAAANPQTAMMNKLALYVFPLGVVVGGPFLPLAIILYWFANNIWTFGQQHYVFGMIEKEDEAKKQEVIAAPGGERTGTGRQAEAQPQDGAGERQRFVDANDDGTDSDPTAPQLIPTDSDGSDGGDADATPKRPAQPEKPNSPARNNGPSNRTPRPGARPKKRKR